MNCRLPIADCQLRKIRAHLASAAVFATVILLSGCATPKPVSEKHFDFSCDTFAFSNELVWEYHFNANGKWSAQKHEPVPDYAQHCFVVARSARQFFANARFDASQPVADETVYRELIRRVAKSNPRSPLSDSEKIVIPGYTNLREFSRAQEHLLKEGCGGAWQSYLQRGNWRMVFPFTQNGQMDVAEKLMEDLKRGWPATVHAVTFPKLSLNHALLIFDAKKQEKKIQFTTYDPNDPEQPITITFDLAAKEFFFPQTKYFAGGPVHIYEIYSAWNY